VFGERNDVHPYAVIGGDPQDRAFNPSVPGRLIVGDDNVFRESVTVSRGTGDEIPTRIGSGCYFMAGSHAGHNVQMGSHVTLANATLIAGHARIGDRVVFGGGAVVHQFTIVGENAMLQGLSGVSMHVPPYCLASGVNLLAGLNIIGLRRSGVTPKQREQVKAVFKALCAERSGTPLRERVDSIRHPDLEAPALRFLDFVAAALDEKPPRSRGICALPIDRAKTSEPDPA